MLSHFHKVNVSFITIILSCSILADQPTLPDSVIIEEEEPYVVDDALSKRSEANNVFNEHPESIPVNNEVKMNSAALSPSPQVKAFSTVLHESIAPPIGASSPTVAPPLTNDPFPQPTTTPIPTPPPRPTPVITSSLPPPSPTVTPELVFQPESTESSPPPSSTVQLQQSEIGGTLLETEMPPPEVQSTTELPSQPERNLMHETRDVSQHLTQTYGNPPPPSQAYQQNYPLQQDPSPQQTEALPGQGYIQSPPQKTHANPNIQGRGFQSQYHDSPPKPPARTGVYEPSSVAGIHPHQSTDYDYASHKSPHSNKRPVSSQFEITTPRAPASTAEIPIEIQKNNQALPACQVTTCPAENDPPIPVFTKGLYQTSLPDWPLAGTIVHLGISANCTDYSPVQYKLHSPYSFVLLTSDIDIIFSSDVGEGAYVGPNNVMLMEITAYVAWDNTRWNKAALAIAFPRRNQQQRVGRGVGGDYYEQIPQMSQYPYPLPMGYVPPQMQTYSSDNMQQERSMQMPISH